jgi:glucose-1-phosphate thymidylyltransferase
MKALVLAAGYATRLYPLTENFPKPLLMVGRRTILDYLLERVAKIPAVDEVWVVTNNKYFNHFQSWAIDPHRRSDFPQLNIKIFNDGTLDNQSRLGAIGDIVFVLKQTSLEDDLLISAGDNIYLFDFIEMLNLFNEKSSDVILGYRIESLEKLRRTGVMLVDKQSRVLHFEEKPANPKSNLGAPALYMLQASTLPMISRYLNEGGNPDAPGHFIAWLYQQHSVYAYLMTQPYYDIGNLESYQTVCQRFASPTVSN